MGSNVATGLLLTTLAGLATALGGLLGVMVRKPGPRLMASTLGFAAGVMVYVSFVELLGHAIIGLGFAWANVAFFGGLSAMFFIDVAIPHDYFGEKYGDRHEVRLMRTGLLVALGLGIHDFPEGLAVFAGTLHSVKLGAAIAVAIAVHNIPEGLAVAAPIAAAGGRRGRAFLWAFLSGLAEPAGALVAAFVLFAFLSEALVGALMGAVAGFMVYVALDELVPASREYGHGHLAIVSAAGGMAVMAASLQILR